jgi:membrane-associated protease RseP (regulator of RpoE activity)
MGRPLTDTPMPGPFEPVPPSSEPLYVPPLPEERPRRSSIARPLILLVLTVLSTALIGGPVYSACIIAILGAHEMGHYLACRYYRIDASLPYFLPMPLVLTGTLGAFIRIREQIPGKRQLFDVGIAGPIAGFLVALPILFIGVSLSDRVPIQGGGLWLGEPLLFKLAIWMAHGPLPEGFTINTHPMAFAAWFGLLATALNLFPVGQLDGGHISYAVLGRASTYVTIATVVGIIALTWVSTSWIAWAGLMVVMLFVFGPRHPRTVDEHVPLDRPRKWLAGFALFMFVVCFTPAPIELLDVIAEPSQNVDRIDVNGQPAPDLGDTVERVF